jgi:hypothetical protein
MHALHVSTVDTLTGDVMIFVVLYTPTVIGHDGIQLLVS